jgi:SPP1 family predicted phage head-tail adaptor
MIKDSTLINPGMFKYEIVIQERDPTIDEYGGLSNNFTDLVTVRAACIPEDTKESLFAGAPGDKNSTFYSVYIRYPGFDIKPEYRLYCPLQDKYLKIMGVINYDEQNIFIYLECEEYVKDVF